MIFINIHQEDDIQFCFDDLSISSLCNICDVIKQNVMANLPQIISDIPVHSWCYLRICQRNKIY